MKNKLNQPSHSLNESLAEYPKMRVTKLFLFVGALYELIIFPWIATLLSPDDSIGLLFILFFPVYLIAGGLFAMPTTLMMGKWHSYKEVYIQDGWWIRTFFMGVLINALFFVWFIFSKFGLVIWFSISLTGGVSAVLAGMSALPVLKENIEDVG